MNTSDDPGPVPAVEPAPAPAPEPAPTRTPRKTTRKRKGQLGRRRLPRRPGRVDLRAVMKRAVEKAGGPPKVADKLKITRHAIYQWDRVPVEHVLMLSGLTGIPASSLRPDIYRAGVDDA